MVNFENEKDAEPKKRAMPKFKIYETRIEIPSPTAKSIATWCVVSFGPP